MGQAKSAAAAVAVKAMNSSIKVQCSIVSSLFVLSCVFMSSASGFVENFV